MALPFHLLKRVSFPCSSSCCSLATRYAPHTCLPRCSFLHPPPRFSTTSSAATLCSFSHCHIISIRSFLFLFPSFFPRRSRLPRNPFLTAPSLTAHYSPLFRSQALASPLFPRYRYPHPPHHPIPRLHPFPRSVPACYPHVMNTTIRATKDWSRERLQHIRATQVKR